MCSRAYLQPIDSLAQDVHFSRLVQCVQADVRQRMLLLLDELLQLDDLHWRCRLHVFKSKVVVMR